MREPVVWSWNVPPVRGETLRRPVPKLRVSFVVSPETPGMIEGGPGVSLLCQPMLAK